MNFKRSEWRVLDVGPSIKTAIKLEKKNDELIMLELLTLIKYLMTIRSA